MAKAPKDGNSTRMPQTEAKAPPRKTVDPEFSCYRPGGMAADEARLSAENPQYTSPTPNPNQDKLKRGWGPSAKINSTGGKDVT